MTNKVSIVIPIYNESKNIKKLLDEIFILNLKDCEYEIIIVDDASIDFPSKKILRYIEDKKIVIIRHEKNLGQSFSLLTGIKLAKFSNILTLDGDGQNNPIDIPILIDTYFAKKNISLVGGIRYNRKDSFVKIYSSKIANIIRRAILHDDCIDTGCSLKIFDKKTFFLFPFFNGIHRFLPALYKGYGKETFFVNVDHRARIYGLSKYGTFLRSIRGINDLIKVAKIIKKFKRSNV